MAVSARMNGLFQILKLLLHVPIELEGLRLDGRGHGTLSVNLHGLDLLTESVGLLGREGCSGVASLGQ